MPHGPTIRRADDVIESVLHGAVDVDDIKAMHAQVQAKLVRGATRAVLIDVVNMTRFSPRVREPGVPFLVMLRENDVHLVVVRGAAPLVRMTAAAIALAANLPLRFVADDVECAAVVAEHIAKLKRKV